MTETSNKKVQEQPCKRCLFFCCLAALAACSVLSLSGCVHIPPQQQRLVSKSNMQFSGSAVFSYQDRLLTQFESGSASFTGGQAGECGSCVGGGQ